MSEAVRSPAALAVATIAAVICALVNDPAVISAIVVLWFLSVVPGALVCEFLHLEGGGAYQWAAILGASFAVDAVLSELMLYAHIWTPTRALLVLAVLALGALVARRATARMNGYARVSDPSALGGDDGT
jgi:hypothetical protein